MGSLAVLIKSHFWIIRNVIRNLQKESYFKLSVILGFLCLFWIGAYFFFYHGLRLLLFFPAIGPLLIERILGLVFAGIFFMLVISSSITSYTTIYCGKEVEFLFTFPVEYGSVFVYKFLESFIFCSWSVIFLILPILFAYTTIQRLDSSFLIFSFLFSLILTFLATILGTILTCLWMRFFPKRRIYKCLWFLIIGALFFSLHTFRTSLPLKGELITPYHIFDHILSHTRWSEFSFSPSYWLSKGILSLAKKSASEAVFFFLLLISNLLFFLVILEALMQKFYYVGWIRRETAFRLKPYISGHLNRIMERLLCFFKSRIQALIIKDIKVFCRDSRLWLQFAIFFGFILIYILNLRTLPFKLNIAFWKNLITILNLGAISLTTAMLNVRFVYPSLSLEGMRFWILGLAPLKIKEIIWEKWFLSFFVSSTISMLLMFFSGIMLGVSGRLLALSLATTFLLCFGSCGLSLGLGAMFPNFKEDNPNAIISGFGGTLLLVLSLMYVGIIIALEALWLQGYLYLRFRGITVSPWILSSVSIIFISCLTCVLPLKWGIRRLEKMEF